MVESAAAPEGGGTRKAPSDFPYMSDWACVSNGSYVGMVIESLFDVNATLFDVNATLFDVNATLFDGNTANPRLSTFDPAAKLKNLRYQGSNYSIDHTGIIKAGIIRPIIIKQYDRY